MAKTWEDLRKKLLAVPGAKESLCDPEYLAYVAYLLELRKQTSRRD